MNRIDINCDMGEGLLNDAEIMPYISSANIACGFHAGNKETMRRTIDLALLHNVAIGAHPSYPDRDNFGRIDILGKKILLSDLPSIITDQVSLLHQVCKDAGANLHHVKLHGALYNRAAWDKEVNTIVCKTIGEAYPGLCLYGLSGSFKNMEEYLYDLKFVNEVFADRTYQDDGSLTPRTQANALIEDIEEARKQVIQIIQHNSITTVTGKTIPIHAETVCIHGDGAHAVLFAGMLYNTCHDQNWQMVAPC